MDDYIKANIHRQNAGAARLLAEANSGCNPNSRYHDLKCGHRIRTEHAEDCGPNCRDGPAGTSIARYNKFICRTCVIGDIQAERMLNKFTLSDSSTSLDEEIRFISEEMIQAQMSDGSRDCTPVNKETDGRIQFFKDFAAEIEAGVEDKVGAHGKNITVDVDRKFKRPSAAAPSRTGKNTMRVKDGRWKARDERWSPYQVALDGDPSQTHPKVQRSKSRRNPTTCDDPALETLFQQSGRDGNSPPPAKCEHGIKRVNSAIYTKQHEDLSGCTGPEEEVEMDEDKATKVVRELLGGMYSSHCTHTRSSQG